jgi:CheY-like chemotaxis protein
LQPFPVAEKAARRNDARGAGTPLALPTPRMPTERAVLVVEDHDDTRDVTTELLRGEGYLVRTAVNGMSALASLARDPECGVVILDWRLPDMDGGDVLRTVRAEPRLAGVPVIVVSADGLTADRVRAAGGTAFLRKPVAPDALLALVARHVRTAHGGAR